MGQLLSVPLVLAGVAWMVWSIRRKLAAASVVPRYVEDSDAPKGPAAPRSQAHRTGKKRR
jgi:hypothetical protein